MVVAFVTERIGTFHNPPAWGDERLAIGISKYLLMHKMIERVDILNKNMSPNNDVDIVILLQRIHPQRGSRATIYWYQNDHDYKFDDLVNDFDGLIFASTYHRDKALTDLPTLYPWIYEPVVYADPDEFPIRTPTDKINVVYLGNNIKGDAIRNKYIDPALPFGLRVYGTGFQNTPLAPVFRGPLRGLMSTSQLYTNTDIVLACHLEPHYRWNMPVVRATEGLLCKCLVISDRVGEHIYGDRVEFTDGGADMQSLLAYWIDNEKERKQKIELNRAWAIGNLSMEIQASRIVTFLKQFA